MATVTGTVEAALIPNKWGKNSILVGEVWYSTDPKYMTGDIPRKGDVVEFDSGKTGKYINNLTVTSKGAGSDSSAKSAGGGYSNLGVELGHASNVAKDMANTYFAGKAAGSDEWYKYWVTHTEKVYTVMKKLRAKHEAPVVSPVGTDDVVVLAKAKPSSKPVETADEIEDIFS